MQLTPVTSSNVAATGYDPATKTLAVKYKSGGLYHYFGVPPELHADMGKSKSIGGFISANVVKQFKFLKQEVHA